MAMANVGEGIEGELLRGKSSRWEGGKGVLRSKNGGDILRGAM